MTMEENRKNQSEKLMVSEIKMEPKDGSHFNDDECLSSIPIGYKFSPTDEELIVHYLKPKNLNLPFSTSMIRSVDVYYYSPEELTEMYPGEKRKDCYFFTTRKKESSLENKPNKKAGNGYWISQGIQNVICSNNQPIGIKNTFNFYEGEVEKEMKTDWIMQEYTLHLNNTPSIVDIKLEEWVLCNIYNKAEEDESNLCPNDEDISDVSDQDSPVFNQLCRLESCAIRSPLIGSNGHICSPRFELQFIWSSPPKLHEIDIIQTQCCDKQSSLQGQPHDKDFLILNESCLIGKPRSDNCAGVHPKSDFSIELAKLKHHSFPCRACFSPKSNVYGKLMNLQPNRDCSILKRRRSLEMDNNHSCRLLPRRLELYAKHCHDSPLPSSSRHDSNPCKLPMKELVFSENSCQLENPTSDDVKAKELNDHVELEQPLSVDDMNFVNDILKFLDDHYPSDIPTPECFQRGNQQMMAA